MLNRLIVAQAMLVYFAFAMATPALAIEKDSLKKQGFQERFENGRTIWVNDQTHQTIEFRKDGSAEHTLYAYRTSLDNDGQPFDEKYAEYVISYGSKGKVTHVTDQFGIPHLGDYLQVNDQGVSFTNHFGQQVTLRPDGSRLVANDRGQGASVETWDTGQIRTRYDANGEKTHLYGYKRLTPDQVANEPGQATMRLKAWIATNSRGQKEHWALTDTDASTRRQTWMLQNGANGQTVALNNVHRIDVGRDGDLIVEHPTGSENRAEGRIVRSSTRYNLDGARVEHQTAELSGGKSLETIRVFGKEKEPAYELKTVRREDQGNRKTVSVKAVMGKLRYTSNDGKFWTQETSEDEPPDYYLGSFQIFPDGSFCQRGFAVDAKGQRLVENETPAPLREFMIDTSGLALELHRFGDADTHLPVGRIYRNRLGDILKLVDARRRACSFVYSNIKDDNGKFLVRGVNDYRGEYRASDDQGRSWNRPLAGQRRDVSDTMTMQIDRENGSVTWEDYAQVAKEKLDGTLTINRKVATSRQIAERRQVYNREGLIVLSVNERGDRFEFEYDDNQTIVRCITDHPDMQPSDGVSLSDYHVDWTGKVSFEKRHTATDRVERHVLLPSGMLQSYDALGRLRQISHSMGHESEYRYDDQGLVSLTRTTRNGRQRIQRSAPGVVTITHFDGDGQQTSAAAKANMTVSPAGLITLDHGVQSDARAPRLQAFLPDGRRRLIRQDLSGQRLDPFDRMTGRSKGDLIWSVRYQGDEDIPCTVADVQAYWERSETPSNAGENGPLEYLWKDARNNLTWTGVANTVGGQYQFRKDDGHAIEVFDDETEHTFANGVQYTQDADGRITMSKSDSLRFWILYDESGAIKEVTTFVGEGEDVETKDNFSVGAECEQITLNQMTGLPVLHLDDGVKKVYHHSGAVLMLSRDGLGSELKPHDGASIAPGQNLEGELVERIEYDSQHDQPRFVFKDGKYAILDSDGRLIARHADGRLAWTAYLGLEERYRADYQYDSQATLTTIEESYSDGKATFRRLFERQDGQQGQPGWRMSEPGKNSHVLYDAITVDPSKGEHTRYRDGDAGRVVEQMNAWGGVSEYALLNSGTLSSIQYRPSREINHLSDPSGSRFDLFRNRKDEFFYVRTGQSSARKLDDGQWEVTWGANESWPGQLTPSREGLIGTQQSVTTVTRPNGRSTIDCADGSRTILHSEGFISQHFLAKGSDVQEVRVRIGGACEIVFLGGARHVQRANEQRIQRFSATGKSLGSFRGAICVASYGTTLEVDLDNQFATLFPRDGGKARMLTRKISDDGAQADYYDGRHRVDLSRFRARAPDTPAPPVGFGVSLSPAPLLTLLYTINSADAQAPRLSPVEKANKPLIAAKDDEFKTLDRNGDGKLTINELKGRQRIWLRGDKNRDRALTFEEWKAVRGGPNQARKQNLRQRWVRGQLAAFDEDRDGKLSRDESPLKVKSLLDRFDADGDGLLDSSELENYQQRA